MARSSTSETDGWRSSTYRAALRVGCRCGNPRPRPSFSGEILYDGSQGPDWPPADPAAYGASLRRLRALPVAMVHPFHYGSFDGTRMRILIADQLADLGAG